jgi:apolipoprotein N-acyltransferase
MVVKGRREEEQELDRRIDLINVVFGAAHMSAHRGFLLALALVILVCLLVAIRNLIHLWQGTHHGSWKLPMGVVIGGLAFFFMIRGDAYLDLSALVPVVTGWAAAFAVVLSSHIFMLRKYRNE